MLLSIDPGQTEHGYVLLTSHTFKPVAMGKESATYLGALMVKTHPLTQIVIEKPVCRKWAGSEVSDTAIMAGYLAGLTTHPTYFITRSKVRGHLKCTRGGDSAVKGRLQGMFAPGVRNHGKGTKKEPGFFYGFSADIWQAFALAVVFRGMENGSDKDVEYLLANRLE